MPVMPVMIAGMGMPGLTSCEKVTVCSPLTTRTAPISVILAKPGVAPVVSRSTTVKTTSARSRRCACQWERPMWRSPSHAKRSSLRTMSSTSACTSSGDALATGKRRGKTSR